MGAIAGIHRWRGMPVRGEEIDRVAGAMSYRGAISPRRSEDGRFTIVCDGMLDADEVLRAYRQWGNGCLARLDGDFAFAIWDAQSRELFCARDRLGNRPFHYWWSGSELVFASDLHAVLAHRVVPRRLNDGMLAEFLAAEFHSVQETLWEGVLRLPAAHFMVVSEAGARKTRYWQPPLDEALPYRRDEEYAEHYRQILEDSVRRCARSDRPLAIEVSGGLDSSAVLAVAVELLRRGELVAPAIEAYTMTFPGDAEADELQYAREVATHLGVTLHEVPGSTLPPAWYADRARWSRDFPGFPNASMNAALLERSASRGCRVTLTGEAGDLWLTGSRAYYAEELAAGRWRELGGCFAADRAAYGLWRACRWLLGHGVFRRRGAVHAEAKRAAWLAPQMRSLLQQRRETHPPRIRRPASRAGQEELLQCLDDAFIAQVIERVELDAATRGIEMRHPFRDHRLVEFAMGIPARLRLRGDLDKYIHIKAFAGRLPERVLQRRSKAGFSGLFGRQLAALEREITGDIPARRPQWVEAAEVRKLFQRATAQPGAGWPMWPLWGLYGSDLVMEGRGRMTAVESRDSEEAPMGEDRTNPPRAETKAAAPAVAAAPRKTYSKPLLKVYGSVSALTLGSTGSIGDGKVKKTSSAAMKQDLIRVAEHPLGFGIYLYRYRAAYRDRWGHGVQLGVLAEEVEPIVPAAVSRSADGMVLVDYAMLGVHPAA